MKEEYEEFIENAPWVNDYKIVWVNSDYKIKETVIEAESKKKAIIEFFTEIDANDVENFKIKRL